MSCLPFAAAIAAAADDDTYDDCISLPWHNLESQSKVTSSRCTTRVEMGTHTFEIIRYSLKKGMGIGNFVQSAIFSIGGHYWAIGFYHDGTTEGTKMFASVSLVLMDEGVEVRASYDLFLVNQIKCQPERIMCSESIATMFVAHNYFVARQSKLELPSNGYIQNDCMKIQCDLIVVMDSELCRTKGGFKVQVPPSNLSEHFSRLLLDEEEADVIFNVRGETFLAHKIILATRSPVFKAQLYGKMKETKACCVTVEDIQPDIFKSLLTFIYTDALPIFDDDINIKHLLVAANKYAMERLKLLCASILVEHLCVETMATTLALADQHNCKSFRDICIEFMAPSDKMRAIVTTQGYANLKRTCPSVIVDVLERTSRCRKI